MADIKDRLRDVISDKWGTQKDFYDASGISAATFHRIGDSGKLSAMVRSKLERVGVNPDYVEKGVEPKFIQPSNFAQYRNKYGDTKRVNLANLTETTIEFFQTHDYGPEEFKEVFDDVASELSFDSVIRETVSEYAGGFNLPPLDKISLGDLKYYYERVQKDLPELEKLFGNKE